MIAAVLCGGYGTRLRPIIGEHQKCAVDVGGRPWIHYVLDFLERGGVERALLLTGYMPEEIERAADAWVKGRKMAVTCLHSTPAGIAPHVALAHVYTESPRLLLVNGDTLVDEFPLGNFLARCRTAPKPYVIRGMNVAAATPGETGISDAGIAYVGSGFGGDEARVEWPVVFQYLDIGTPEGLAEARRRYAKPQAGQ